MRLRIAGMTIAVASVDPAVEPHVDDPVSRFLISGNGPADLTLSIQRSVSFPAAGPAPLFDSGGVWKMFDDGGELRIDCTSVAYGDAPYKVAFFDRDFSTGRVLLRSDVFAGAVDPLAYPLDEVIVANLLGRGRGIELHGCGVIDSRGRGKLFVGQSGAGKTTTARIFLDSVIPSREDGEESPSDDAGGPSASEPALSERSESNGRLRMTGVEVLSDDRVVVRFDGATPVIFGTPWHGEAPLSSPSSAPLDAIYLLKQAPATRLVEIPPAEAAASLFGCSFPLFHDAGAVGFVLDFLERLVRTVPVRVLEFTPDRSVLEVTR